MQRFVAALAALQAAFQFQEISVEFESAGGGPAGGLPDSVELDGDQRKLIQPKAERVAE